MKKFTETETWSKRWFFALPQWGKLGWKLVNDEADHAGVVDLPDELLAAYVGEPGLTMERLAELVGEKRLMVLADGKWWLPGYIEFQHPGGISAIKKQHVPACASVVKHRLPVVIVNDAAGRYAAHNARVNATQGGDAGGAACEVVPGSDAAEFWGIPLRAEVPVAEGEGEWVGGRPPARLFQPVLEVQEVERAEMRADPWPLFTGKTGLGREDMIGYARTMNHGSEAYTPESLVDSYMAALVERGMETYQGKPLTAMTVQGDFPRFIHKSAMKDPAGNCLVRRADAAAAAAAAERRKKGSVGAKVEAPWEMVLVAAEELMVELPPGVWRWRDLPRGMQGRLSENGALSRELARREMVGEAGG